MKLTILLLLAFILAVVVGTWNGIQLREAQAQVADLERRNAVLVDRAAKWEKLAKDFEALNRQCLQITFGGGR